MREKVRAEGRDRKDGNRKYKQGAIYRSSISVLGALLVSDGGLAQPCLFIK